MSKKESTAKLKMVSIKKILVPIDFSECSSNAIRQAVHLAQTFLSHIEIVHVITPVYITPITSEMLIPYDNVNYKKMLKDAEKKLLKIAKEIQTHESVSVSVTTQLNVVYTGILERAKKINADLIIMGTHGTSGVKEFIAGSNAFRVVRDSGCPVLTIQKKIANNKIKNIVLPIRLEINSRQKVELVATLAKIYSAKILITGYLKDSDERDEQKVKQYCAQVEALLNKETIAFKTFLLKDKNFTKAIINHAKKQKADMVAVMTTHNFSLDQLLNGPYAEQFVNHSKIPILSVPDRISFDYSYTPSLSGGYQNN